MTIVLEQGSDSTDLTFKLEGVPSGEEADVERALKNFYIQGLVRRLKHEAYLTSGSLKQMGLVLESSSRSYHVAPRKPRRRKASSTPWYAAVASPQVLGVAAVVALAATLVGLVVSSLRT